MDTLTKQLYTSNAMAYHRTVVAAKAAAHQTVVELADLPACPDCTRIWQERPCGIVHMAVAVFQELNYIEFRLSQQQEASGERPQWLPEPQDGWARLGHTVRWVDRCDRCGGAAFPFMVTDEVWTAAVGLNVPGIRCVECIELGLGRFLRPDDFTKVPLNTTLRFGIEVGRGTRDVTDGAVTLRVPLPFQDPELGPSTETA